MKNKCEELKMHHAWKDTTPNIFYTTNPPQFPFKQETCFNCGLTRYHREKIEQWIEYSDNQPHEDFFNNKDGSITVLGNDIFTNLTVGNNAVNLEENKIYKV